MNQQPLFPIEVKQLIPNAGASADLRYFAIGDDGHEYAAKESLPFNPTLPASEYLGYCLAAACHVAVPMTALLEMPDGTTALGSRFEGGATGFCDLSGHEQSEAFSQCSPELTALLTLDVFLSNDDRHGGNFLHRKGQKSNQWTMIAIDFSRAMWYGGFPAKPPIDTVSIGNTSITIVVMKKDGLWDAKRLGSTATSISAITAQQYRAWVDAMPPAWVLKSVADSVDWWDSPARASRILEVLKSL